MWRALAQNKTGYILESLDAHKTKLVANLSTAKIAALNEITLFGETEDLKLVDILERMKNAPNIPDAKADGKMLRGFFREVAPGHDEEKVYSSDMKKVVNWFGILKDLPLFEEEDVSAPADKTSPAEAAPAAEVVTVTEEALALEAPLAVEEVPASMFPADKQETETAEETATTKTTVKKIKKNTKTSGETLTEESPSAKPSAKAKRTSEKKAE